MDSTMPWIVTLQRWIIRIPLKVLTTKSRGLLRALKNNSIIHKIEYEYNLEEFYCLYTIQFCSSPFMYALAILVSVA